MGPHRRTWATRSVRGGLDEGASDENKTGARLAERAETRSQRRARASQPAHLNLLAGLQSWDVALECKTHLVAIGNVRTERGRWGLEMASGGEGRLGGCTFVWAMGWVGSVPCVSGSVSLWWLGFGRNTGGGACVEMTMRDA